MSGPNCRSRPDRELLAQDAPTDTGRTRLAVTGSLRPGFILHFAGVDIQYSGGILNVRSGRHGWLDIMPEHPHKAHLLCLPADADSAPAMTDDRGRLRPCETASGGVCDAEESAIRNPKSEMAADPPLCVFGPGGKYIRTWPAPRPCETASGAAEGGDNPQSAIRNPQSNQAADPGPGAGNVGAREARRQGGRDPASPAGPGVGFAQ